MITLIKKDKEVDIKLEYSETIGGIPKVTIDATGDLSHHLIEGLFEILDRLARMETCSHQSEEWRNK
jgi:hypothetical protein